MERLWQQGSAIFFLAFSLLFGCLTSALLQGIRREKLSAGAASVDIGGERTTFVPHDPELIAKFGDSFEKYPLASHANEVESGGGKTTFEVRYKGNVITLIGMC